MNSRTVQRYALSVSRHQKLDDRPRVGVKKHLHPGVRGTSRSVHININRDHDSKGGRREYVERENPEMDKNMYLHVEREFYLLEAFSTSPMHSIAQERTHRLEI